MTGRTDKALPPGSLVLVTGINSYVGSHIANQLLRHGYRVRGTARSADKLAKILKTLRTRNPGAQVDGVVVEDMQAEDGFSSAIKDCVGIVHVASDVTLTPDPNKVIPVSIKGLEHALKAAAASPTLKRFVYTSSVVTLPDVVPDVPGHVHSGSWDTKMVQEAWAAPPYEESRSLAVYGASKIESEQYAWKFVREERVGFVFNTVLPAFVVGPVLEGANSSSAGFLRKVYEGDEATTEYMRHFPANWHVDAEDTAILHVAALVEEDVKNERILAIGSPYTYAESIEVLKEMDPTKTDYPEPANNHQNLVTADTARSVELLKRYGRTGLSSLKESVRRQFAKA